jgi:hypothetical protein
MTRATIRLAVAATALGLALPLPAFAAPDQVAQTDPVPQAKEVALTQKQIDGVIAAQPQMQAIESKLPQGAEDKPDPKIEAKLEGVAKKNGFSGLGEYSDVSSSIGVVMAGIDPETKSYVGPQAVIKKQMAQVKADTSMPPKEKKEALDELSAALQPGNAPKPSQNNIDLVTKNFDKLNSSMQQQGGAD